MAKSAILKLVMVSGDESGCSESYSKNPREIDDSTTTEQKNKEDVTDYTTGHVTDHKSCGKRPIFRNPRKLSHHSKYNDVRNLQLKNKMLGRLKLAKNQAKAKQHPEAELLLFEIYLLSSSTLSSKTNMRYSQKYAKN